MRKRRNKRLGFGFINCVLALALVIATLVVTQTNALQYLKGKLANGSVESKLDVKVPKKAKAKDIKPLITLKNAVKGKKKLEDEILPNTGKKSRELVRTWNRRRWERKHPDEVQADEYEPPDTDKRL